MASARRSGDVAAKSSLLDPVTRAFWALNTFEHLWCHSWLTGLIRFDFGTGTGMHGTLIQARLRNTNVYYHQRYYQTRLSSPIYNVPSEDVRPRLLHVEGLRIAAFVCASHSHISCDEQLPRVAITLSILAYDDASPSKD